MPKKKTVAGAFSGKFLKRAGVIPLGRRAQAEIWQTALRKINEDDRELLDARFGRGMSFQEIAVEHAQKNNLAKPLSQERIKQHLNKARNKLAFALRDLMLEETQRLKKP